MPCTCTSDLFIRGVMLVVHLIKYFKNIIVFSLVDFQRLFFFAMDEMNEQYFKTINGLTIRCSVFTSADTLKITIENQMYTNKQKQIIHHILIIILFSTILNIFLQQYSIVFLLNSICLILIVIKCYMYVNLIKFGKQMSFSYITVCVQKKTKQNWI